MADNRFTFSVQRLPETLPDSDSLNSSSSIASTKPIRRVDTSFVEGLLQGKKNPVQCLNEYCSMTKKEVIFTETGVSYQYANYVTIDGVRFAQGVGKNKKEAKIAAAKHVFAALLDLDEDALDPRFAGMSDVKFDRHGHRIIENGSTDPEHLFTPASIQQLTEKLNLLATDRELFQSKGVAHTLQNANNPERSVSRASSNFSESPILHSGRESVVSSRLTSVSHQHPTSTASMITTGSTTSIENPITTLQEYCKLHMIPFDIKAEICQSHSKTPNQRQLYRAWVFIENEETKISDVYAYTVVDAKRRAAQRALEALMKKQPSQIINSNPLVASNPYEQIANIVANFIKHNRANDHTGMFDTIHNRFYAAVVVKQTQGDPGRVVAFAMGSRCPHPESVDEMGESLLDCHALSLVRRAFLQYLYGELINYSSNRTMRSVLETSEKDPNKTQLKNHVSIHLLVSGAPSGDAREFLPPNCDGPLAPYDFVQMQSAGHAPIYEHPEHGHLRYKLSIGMETIDADPLQRFAIMSCSDKIIKWNMLGLQGALLSNLIEPIKLASITFLSGFKQSQTSRAICCRLDKTPDDIRIHHPMIGRVTYPLAQPQEFDSDLSYVWSISTPAEVIDARNGRPTTGGISMLSKVALLSEYRHVCQRLKMQSLCPDINYNALKQTAHEYHQKKRAMINYFEQKKFGYWSFEKKHLEQFHWQSSIRPIQRNSPM